MHILLLTAYFPPDVGSASHLFYELGQSFVAHGHRVSVVTGFPGYHAQGDLRRYRHKLYLHDVIEGISVHRVAVPYLARDTAFGRGLWQFTCAAIFTLAGFNVQSPDVVLVYSPPLPLGLTALLWRRLRGAPFVLNVQDLFPQSAIDLGILRHELLIGFFYWLERFLYRHVNAITAHSSGNRDYVVQHGGRPESTFVVPNSVAVDNIRPGPKNNDLRKRLGLNGHFVVSFAGIMGYSQDVDTVLSAADILRNERHIHFLLVGDGVEKDRLIRKSKQMGLTNVTWLPMQSREDYPSVLHASDVGLATLRADVKTPVVPSKILSIMAAGRPVIAASDARGDVPHLLQEAQAGFCLPPEQPHLLADRLLQLSQNPDLCLRLGRNGRRYAVEYLSTDTVAARYEAIFRTLIESKKS